MHTFNTKSGHRIHYSPDMSGQTYIVHKSIGEVQMPCEELVDFVAMLVRNSRIAEIENDADAEVKIADLMMLSSKELLGLK